MLTLYQEMQKTAKSKPNDTSVVFYGRRYSFGEILSLVDRAAAGLKSMGIKRGDVVTLCIPNTPSAQIAFYALNRIGAIVSLVHPYTAPPQLAATLAETKSRLLIAYDLYLREKGAQLCTDVKILQSRCDYFMSRVARLYYRFSNRKKPRWHGDSFEDLFGNKRSYKYYVSNGILGNNSNSKAGGITKNKRGGSFSKTADDGLTDPPAEFGENEPAVYLPSGGTSGTPKTIVHNNRVFNELCHRAAYFLSEPLENYDAMYTVLPIFHGFGLCMNMHMCSVVGIKNVMSIKFSPRAMAKAIKKEGVNVITGVPTMYSRLLACKQFLRADLSPIKDCFVGGDSAPVSLVQDFNTALKNGGSRGRLYPGYGLAETVAVCVVNCARHEREDSVGAPLPGTRLKIVGSDMLNCEDEKGSRTSAVVNTFEGTEKWTVLNNNGNEACNNEIKSDALELPAGEVGEICISSPQLMLGYLDGESSVRVAHGERWLFTGDLGWLDGDGFLYFKQRAKNMIKVSGVPVFPSEIEAATEKVAGVIRAAAVPMTDARWGSAVKLFVESTCADHDALKLAILDECKRSLMRYAIPKAIEIKDSLPLNQIGKIDRNKLI